MKQKVFVFSLIWVFLFSSCVNEELTPGKAGNEQVFESTLVNELKALNDSLLTSQTPETKGFWKKALTFCAIAGADAAGAYEVGKIGASIGSIVGPKGTIVGAAVGGLIGGAGASYGAYRTTRTYSVVSPQMVTAAYVSVKEDNPNLINFYPNQISLKLPENKKGLQDIGAKHNLVLKKLANQEFSSTPIANVFTPEEVQIIESSEFENGYYSVLNTYVYGDYDTYIENNGTTGNTVMKLYLDIMNKYPEKANDVEFISNKYIELISLSADLSEDEKDLLYSAISVAVSSFEYWENELQQP